MQVLLVATKSSRITIAFKGGCFAAVTTPEKGEQTDAVTRCSSQHGGAALPKFNSLDDLENMKTAMIGAFGEVSFGFIQQNNNFSQLIISGFVDKVWMHFTNNPGVSCNDAGCNGVINW